MDTFQRIRRLLRMRTSDADAEATLDKVLADVETCLAEARGQLAASVAEAERLRDLMSAEALHLQHMLARARYALRAGDETLAREAIQRYLHAQRLCACYQRFWEKQQGDVDRTQALLQQLETKHIDLEFRRQRLVARRNLAQARRVLAETLYGERGRMQVEWAEETMTTEELTVDAYQELTGERIITALNDPLPTVDAVLAELRKELELSAPTHDGTEP